MVPPKGLLRGNIMDPRAFLYIWSTIHSYKTAPECEKAKEALLGLDRNPGDPFHWAECIGPDDPPLVRFL
jgi:hypothetical protein